MATDPAPARASATPGPTSAASASQGTDPAPADSSGPGRPAAPAAAAEASAPGPSRPAASVTAGQASASGSGRPAASGTAAQALAPDLRHPAASIATGPEGAAAADPVPDDAVDLGWIAGVPGSAAAELPTGASATAQPQPQPRRRTVIGTEGTGSIPVHLLFRDEAEGGDDGGPATVPVPKTTATATSTPPKKPGIPAPTRPTPAPGNRPAPTADPKLVERPGPVLAGWVGVVGGMVALLGCAALVWWAGAVPGELARMLRLPARPYNGIPLGQWALLALGVVMALFFLGGLGRGRVGYALVLTLFGDYRGTVRRTGLLWVSPLLLRRRVDVRLRHWRSEPLPAVDAKGTALNVVVLVVWRIRDTVRAALGVDRHEEYLREQVEAAMARVLSQLPADAFHEDAPTLRDSEAVGEALTRMLSAECAPVGIDVFSAQPTRIEYAPEVAAAMQRRRIAALDAKHRDSVLTSVVDAVDDVVHRLTSRGLVELDDYEKKALVKDLTVAFYTGRSAPGEGA